MKKSLILLAAVAVAAFGLAAQAAGIDLQALVSPEAAMGLAGAGAFGTTKYKQRGSVMDWLNGTGVAVVSGKMVVIGTKVGVALGAIPIAGTGSVGVAGVYEYAKLSTDVIAQGAAVYYDAGNDRLTTTAGGNTLAGYAWTAAANPSATVQVLVNGVPG
jgi:predicted RecA/RadA family phage recombinase